MHRCVAFFSVFAIAALASENTKSHNEEFYVADPDQIHNPMPLNPENEFNPDESQDLVTNGFPILDQDTENSMPFFDTDEEPTLHIPMDFPPISDILQDDFPPIPNLEVENTLNTDEQEEEVVFQEPIYTTLGTTADDDQESQQDNYEPIQLSSFPSPNDIKNPMPLNPDPWDGEGEEPVSRQNGTVRNARAVAGPPTYHGGRVLTNPINVYIVWYGNWGNLRNDQTMIEYFFDNIQSSAWWQMATRYTQNKNGVTSPVTPNVRFAGSIQSPMYQGNSLGSPQVVFNVVNSVLSANSLPADPDGVYFVLTAPNIAVSNFCVNFCGWHSGFNYKSMSILVAMVPHSASSTRGATCRTNVGAGPGFGFGASAGGYNMVNVIAHELVESATDPIGNAWYRDSDHYENADMCSWLFGPVRKTSNYNYNVQLGSKYFLIQQFYDLKSGRCALA